MIRTYIRLSENDPYDRILPDLIGRVFHVSRSSNLELILQTGGIQPGKGNKFESSFGYSKRSYFHARDCVSLFDYRNLEEGVLEKTLGKCSPFQAFDRQSKTPGIAIVFLSSLRQHLLRPWTLSTEEKVCGEMIVPWVEVGHKGPIALEWIDEVYRIDIELDPEKENLRRIFRKRFI